MCFWLGGRQAKIMAACCPLTKIQGYLTTTCTHIEKLAAVAGGCQGCMHVLLRYRVQVARRNCAAGFGWPWVRLGSVFGFYSGQLAGSTG